MKLFTCIAFHFKRERLIYLKKVLQMQQFLADEVNIVITTNTANPTELLEISSIAPEQTSRFTFAIETFSDLPNPWLLTWAHKVVFFKKISDITYTHYMYTEDDIEVTPINMTYWLRTRELLKPFNLYPSFLRIEWSDKDYDWFCTDITSPVSVASAPNVRSIFSDYQYLNMPNPYQGLFLYDRELMLEHIQSETFDIMQYGNLESINLSWGGGIAERANYALTFSNVPSGFSSRNVVPYFAKYLQTDPHCWVHHLPNNYVHGKVIPSIGHLRVRDVLCQ